MTYSPDTEHYDPFMTDMTTYINAIINLCMNVSDKWLLTYGFIAFKRQWIKYDNHVITMILQSTKNRGL